MSKQERVLSIVLAVGTILALLNTYFNLDRLGLLGKLIITIPILAVSAYCYFKSGEDNSKVVRSRIRRIISYYVLVALVLITATKLYGDNPPGKGDVAASSIPSLTATSKNTATPAPNTPMPTLVATPTPTPTPTIEPVTPTPTMSPAPSYPPEAIEAFDSGYRYYMVENYDAAFPLFLESANYGYPKAALYLGTCYQESKGVEQNSYAAFDWFAIAADSGLARAQYRLGYCYHTGFGVFQSEELAFKWFLKSAEQNDDLGLLWTGYCYQYGEGVPQDYDLAVQYYTASRDLGNNSAQRRLNELRRIIG